MCLVHRGVFSTSGDTMSTSGGYHEYVGGFRPQIETEGSAKIEKAILCFFLPQNIERQKSLQKITAKSSEVVHCTTTEAKHFPSIAVKHQNLDCRLPCLGQILTLPPNVNIRCPFLLREIQMTSSP